MSQDTRRQFLQRGGALGLGLAAGGLPGVRRAAAQGGMSNGGKEDRPNIIFVMSDDQRADALSCAGNELIETPNMDRIAAEGTRFPNAFVSTSLCCPSRATCLTGQYSHTHGVFTNPGPGFPPAIINQDSPVYSELLQQAGYETCAIGKWHLTDWDPPRGFDHWRTFAHQGVYRDITLSIDGEKQKKTGFTTDVLTDEAIDYVAQDRDQPFMLFLSYKAPHVPYRPKDQYMPPEGFDYPTPETYDTDFEGKPPWIDALINKVGIYQRDLDPTVRDYYGLIQGVDANLGRLWKTLEHQQLWDNTIIIHIGDNGAMMGEHHLFNKMRMYEPSIRIPILIRDPRIDRQSPLPTQMALNNDLAPTILDMAGLDPHPAMQGRSLMPLLQGDQPDPAWRSDWLYEHLHTKHVTPMIRGVRNERWKYTRYYVPGEFTELYDLQNDPNETVNLADDPDHAQRVEQMQARLEELWAQTNGPPIQDYIPRAREDYKAKLDAKIDDDQTQGDYGILADQPPTLEELDN